MRRSVLLINAALLLSPVAAVEGARFLGDPAVWLFLALATLFVLGDHQAPPEKGARHLSHWLALATGIGIYACFVVSLMTRTGFSLGGAALMLSGVMLRAWSVRTLGPAFVTELVHSPRVTHGPYRFLTHPSEVGLLVTIYGAAWLLGSAAGASLATLWVLPCSIARIQRENEFLAVNGA